MADDEDRYTDIQLSPLQKPPVEVTEKIFYAVLAGEWDGKQTPPLLVALRGNKRLYGIAIKVFYDTNVYHLCPSNGFSLGKLSSGSKAHIKFMKWSIT